MDRAQEREKEMGIVYDLDQGTGTITNRASGKRVMVLSTEAWAMLGSSLRKAFGDGSPTYMRQVGYSIGVSLGSNVTSRPLSATETYRAVPKLAALSGWGKVSYMGDTSGWTRYTARLENCPSCADELAGTPPVCDLLTGVVNGMSDEIFQKPHRVTETRCGYKKDSTCDFLVEEISEPTDEQRHWASYLLFPWLKRK